MRPFSTRMTKIPSHTVEKLGRGGLEPFLFRYRRHHQHHQDQLCNFEETLRKKLSSFLLANLKCKECKLFRLKKKEIKWRISKNQRDIFFIFPGLSQSLLLIALFRQVLPVPIWSGSSFSGAKVNAQRSVSTWGADAQELRKRFAINCFKYLLFTKE